MPLFGYEPTGFAFGAIGSDPIVGDVGNAEIRLRFIGTGQWVEGCCPELLQYLDDRIFGQCNLPWTSESSYTTSQKV